ncbi:hypothetical protein K435DRAFT_706193 [Dendrothele bispora CBS 962.96]|uniref:Uncharacterized protein n=1 Tax=Dendrothele bispora (strain CBS 962.96) TaxID=1314807 RepID=A0A4S8KL15_DENBC|nr:hypothetical protein K435DRAFT_706193 [Dendrothele bispora CBS 962.96]
MVGTLNLYLDPELSYTWREASLISAKAQGHGVYHARTIRQWIHQFLNNDKLPVHKYKGTRSSILEDEDISLEIQLRLSERSKDRYITAKDVVDVVASAEIQEKLKEAGIEKRAVTERTGREWLKKFKWRYSKKRNGMYIDGHEREDVVAYRKSFVDRWQTQYAPRMYTWGNDDDEKFTGHAPKGFVLPVHLCGRPFRLILVTHDESTFYANDQRRAYWIHASEKAKPVKKGEGISLMVSDFLTVEWGRLKSRDGKECVTIPLISFCCLTFNFDREARVLFKAGKNRDGYFDSDDLLAQVDHAIDIFEDQTNGFAQGLFLFDNAPTHQKRAPDALSARKMPKGPSEKWTHYKDGPRMRPGTLPSGQLQDLYFPDDHPTMPGWFKGMQVILEERGLYPETGRLNAQCEGFKCPPERTDCCCRRVLFNQPDFVNQKSALEELIESRGHICDFYPKYHCELNFIEQYWGAGKFSYRNHVSVPKKIEEMEARVCESLDSVPLQQIRRCVLSHGYLKYD